MRILSQNGTIDLPYEMVGLSISFKDKKTIVAYPSGNYKAGDGFWTMGVYSTEEKAKRAIKLLRKAYAGLPIIMRNVDITDDVAEMLKKWEKQGIVYRTSDSEPSSIECVNNGYFQFPPDEEIEV